MTDIQTLPFTYSALKRGFTATKFNCCQWTYLVSHGLRNEFVLSCLDQTLEWWHRTGIFSEVLKRKREKREVYLKCLLICQATCMQAFLYRSKNNHINHFVTFSVVVEKQYIIIKYYIINSSRSSSSSSLVFSSRKLWKSQSNCKSSHEHVQNAFPFLPLRNSCHTLGKTFQVQG